MRTTVAELIEQLKQLPPDLGVFTERSLQAELTKHGGSSEGIPVHAIPQTSGESVMIA